MVMKIEVTLEGEYCGVCGEDTNQSLRSDVGYLITKCSKCNTTFYWTKRGYRRVKENYKNIGQLVSERV